MAAESSGYAAFISYSHTLDGALAGALQIGLEQFAKPWYRPRALRVFRDTTNLAASPGLWSSIEKALAASSWLVLMASPEAARSKWVNREVLWWLENKSPQRLLVVLTEGEFAWDEESADGHTTKAALPPALRGVFLETPRWVDLRWLRNVEQVDQSNPRLRECVVDVAAAIRGVPKDQLVGEHIRQHRRTMGLARGAVGVLTVLLIVAVVAAVVAIGQRDEAVAAQHTAIARAMVAQAEAIRDSNPRGALQFGVAANAIDPSPLTQASLFQTLVSGRYRGTLTSPRSPVFSSDGHTLATISADETVILWDLSGGMRPRRLGPPLTGHTDRVTSVAFSPDGRILASASEDKTVLLWDLTDRSQPRVLGAPLTGYTKSVNWVAFSSDGRTLATASGTTMLLWDVTDRMQPRRLGPPVTVTDSVLNTVTFSPDGHTLATTSSDTRIILWDVTDGTQPRRLGQPVIETKNALGIVEVAFSPDGRTLATVGTEGSCSPATLAQDHAAACVLDPDRTVLLWDLTDRTQPRRVGPPLTGHTDFVESVVFSPDGHTLASASRDKTVLLWDVTDRTQPRLLGLPLIVGVYGTSSVAFSPDGHTLATSGGGTVLWDVTDSIAPRPVGPPLTGHSSWVYEVAFSPDGHTLASASGDKTVLLWDLTDRTHPRSLGPPLTGHGDLVTSVAFSPDGHTLASASGDNTVLLWDLTDRAHPRRLGSLLPEAWGRNDLRESLPVWLTNWLSPVIFSPDGHTLAAGAYRAVLLWDLTDRTRPRPLSQPLTGHKSSVIAMAFSPDGHTLASASAEDETVILWDLTDRTQPRRLGQPLTGHINEVKSVAFSPDGHTLASASSDETVLLWDLTDRTQPRRLGEPLTGVSGGLSSVAFSPDGHTLVTTGIHTVILWDLTDRTQPRRLGQGLTGHTSGVLSVAFSPDGHTLATASADKTVILWDLLALEELRRDAVREACTRAGGPLGKDDWNGYAPGISYYNTCANH